MGLLDLFKQKPQADNTPISDSGRAHVSGFLQPEELNPNLVGFFGLAKYDEMYRTDPDIRRAVRMAINPIQAAAWSVNPYGGDEASGLDREVAADLEWALGLGTQGTTSPLRPRWRGHISEVLPTVVRWGFSPFEITWTSAKRPGSNRMLLTPSRFGLRLSRTIYRWLLDEYHELTAIEQFLPLRGYVTIGRQDLLYYRTDTEGDNYEGVSLLRPCYKPWLLKDKVERMDAIAQELESVGLPTVYPPRAGITSPAVLADLESKLQALRAGELAYLMMPGPKAEFVKEQSQGGWTFEINGRAGSKGGRDPSKTLEHHRDSIAAAFIEEFMRLGQSGVGARATAEVQSGPFMMACEALAAIIENEINEVLIPRWVQLNYGDGVPLPTLQMSLAEEPLEDLRDYVSVLVASGLITPDGELEDFLRERADLPPADTRVRKQVQQMQEAERQQATKQAKLPPEAGGVGGTGKAGQRGSLQAQQDLRSAVDRRRAALAPAAERGAARGPEPGARLLDTPNRSDYHTADESWLGTEGHAGVDGVPTPDLMVDFLPTPGWRCPCGKKNCKCTSPLYCTFIPTVDESWSIDENPPRERRHAGDGTDANRPDALVSRAGKKGSTL